MSIEGVKNENSEKPISHRDKDRWVFLLPLFVLVCLPFSDFVE
jgi:hypothetical protein